ncbi:MAG: hypothetical protein GY803_01360 [Chloroflexi bacterium]|nr:hypothetical protein [Chloroflexota bacterium]
MSYKYDIPEAAYKEAQRRIKVAKDKSATTLSLKELGLASIPPEISQLTNLIEALNLLSVPSNPSHPIYQHKRARRPGDKSVRLAQMRPGRLAPTED